MRVRVWALVLVLAVLVGAAGCGGQPVSAAHSDGTRLFYDGSGRLAAVQRGSTTAVYRFDDAGNRDSVSHVRSSSFDPGSVRSRSRRAPRSVGVTSKVVAQGATVSIRGVGFDPDPMGDVVVVGGGAVGRVLSASADELRVELPPVAVPGPVTVSTAYGRATSRDDLVVAPAEVSPPDVHDVAAATVGRSTELRGSGRTLLTFAGQAGSTVQLHLVSSSGGGCDAAEVGLAGPTGTIVEAGDGSWCDRPARLPMTGTYTATVGHAGAVRATVRVLAGVTAKRLPSPPVAATAATAARTWGPPASDGPAGFPVDLATGLLDPSVTDLALGGSGAADLTRSFSVGDPDLPALAPEEPLARHWSLGGSIALEPSMSYSYLDLVMPDGRRLPFRRVTSGAPDPAGAVFEPSGGAGAGPFAGSQVSYTGSGWELRTRAGTVLGFGLAGSPKRLAWIRSDAGTARFVRAPSGSSAGDGLVGVVSEDGQWARVAHDGEGRIVSATDQVGDEVTYRYGRPPRLFADVLTGVTYRRAGRPPASVGYRYQALTGRLVSVTDEHRDRITFGYDDAGRVTRAGAWRFRYDIGRRQVRVPGRPGSVTLPQIRRAVVAGPGAHRTVSFREVRPRSTPATTAARGPVPGFADGAFIDARGRLAARRTPEGGVTRIGYDAFDRPTSITDARGTSTRFSYTSDGDLASVSDASGTTRYAWNAAGQQTSETDPLGARQQWRYDRAGRLVWARDARGVISRFGYDRRGRVVVARFGTRGGRAPESTVRYGYGRAGLTSVRDSTGGTAIFRYDARGRVVRETTAAGTVATTFDGAGRRTGLVLPGGVRVGYGYDARDRPTRFSLSGAAASVRYDARGRLSSLDLPGGIRGRLAYARGRPVSLGWTRDGHDLAEQRASYDKDGRVSGLSGDLASVSLPASQSRARFDAAHQVSGAGWRYDRAGNVLDDGTHHYTWDARGRLVGVSGPEGSTRYGYDALGRRTTETSGGNTVRYVYDGDDVVQRVAADGTRTSYLRGPDGTPLASSTKGRTTALLPDLFGNVGASVGPDDRVVRYGYDPFGVATSGPSAATPGFRGLLGDSTGELGMGARSYDPSTGRFLSRDTWGIEGGDTDPYRYALGAPTVYTDPSGHAAECVGMALGWAMSVLGPGGGWDDYDVLEDKVQSGQISQDEWTVRADAVSHDIWSGFDVVANVCGTSAVGSSAAALPLLGAGKVSRVLGSLADDAVEGAAATRVGTGFGRISPGVSARARAVLDRLIAREQAYTDAGGSSGLDVEAARFAQKTFSERFSEAGLFKGRGIDEVAEQVRTGTLSLEDVPISMINREGNTLILNTRSAQTLMRAGVPRQAWKVVDQTGDPLSEKLLDRQLKRNGLTSYGYVFPER